MGNESIYSKKLGEPMGYMMKCMYGITMATGVLGLLLCPFILFSDFGSFADLNPVEMASFELNFKIQSITLDGDIK